MSFSSYQSIEDVIRKYPLEITSENFVADEEVELPEWFLDNLHFALARKTAHDNEYFMAENFIYPFLQFTWKNHDKLRVWSHHPLRYDEDLTGEPDYFVSYWPGGVMHSMITKPLLAVAEAKKQDFDQGWGQCLAEMVACQKLNEDETLTIFGIVSTGTVWEFGKLQGTVFTQNPVAYSLATPGRLAGILDGIFRHCVQNTQHKQNV